MKTIEKGNSIEIYSFALNLLLGNILQLQSLSPQKNNSIFSKNFFREKNVFKTSYYFFKKWKKKKSKRPMRGSNPRPPA